MNRLKLTSGTMAFVAVLGTQFAEASGPAQQTSAISSVVRVMTSPVVAGKFNFNGTGTIYANKRVGNDGYFCVLTADHVVSRTGLAAGGNYDDYGIAFGNSPDATGDSVASRAILVGRKLGAAVDLAVLAVKYGAYDAAKDAMVARIWNPLSPDPGIFTGVGFGMRAVDNPANNRYEGDKTYGTQRYYNAFNDGQDAGDVAQWGGYTFQGIRSKTKGTTDVGATPGQGAPMPADSGSPYFTDDLVFDTRVSPKVPWFTNKLFAVHSYGSSYNSPDGTKRYKDYGSENGGVYMNQRYIDWTTTMCNTVVPEPGSVLALGIGTLVVLRRRKK